MLSEVDSERDTSLTDFTLCESIVFGIALELLNRRNSDCVTLDEITEAYLEQAPVSFSRLYARKSVNKWLTSIQLKTAALQYQEPCWVLTRENKPRGRGNKVEVHLNWIDRGGN